MARAATPSTSAARRQRSLWWNAWSDEYPGPRYEPLKHLKSNSDYVLVLHLSGIEYRGPGLSAQPAGEDISGWAEEWLKTGETVAHLQVLLLPDTNYFRVVDRRVEALPVNLKALRDWVPTPSTDREPLEVLRTNTGVDPPGFVFGTVALRFRTTALQGVGSIALSIWSNAGRPLDEVFLKYCVSDAAPNADPPICRGVRPVQETLRGVDSVRIAAEGESAPNAALHFLQLDGRGVVV